MAKCKYREDFPKLVEIHLRKGLTEAQVAKKLGISVSTFEVYKNKHPEFLEAVKKGKAPVDFEVENALLKRALGYTYEEKHTVTKIQGKGDKAEATVAEVKKTVKHIASDPTAAIFWLKNRDPERWRDNKAVEVTGRNGKDLIPEQPLTRESIIKEAKKWGISEHDLFGD